MVTTDRIVIGIAAVAVVLLQVLLAPHIPIGFAVPNFMVALAIARSVARPDAEGLLLPFALGIAYDLLSGGPVGAMAFSLTAVSALSTWLFNRTNNDTVFMALVALAFGVFLTEIAYGTFYLLFGYASGVLEALAYRILPCFAYDFVLSSLAYFLMMRFIRRNAPLASEIRQLH